MYPSWFTRLLTGRIDLVHKVVLQRMRRRWWRCTGPGSGSFLFFSMWDERRAVNKNYGHLWGIPASCLCVSWLLKKITVQDQMAKLLEFIHGGTFVVGSLFSSRVGWSLLCQLVGLSNIGWEWPGWKRSQNPSRHFWVSMILHGFSQTHGGICQLRSLSRVVLTNPGRPLAEAKVEDLRTAVDCAAFFGVPSLYGTPGVSVTAGFFAREQRYLEDHPGAWNGHLEGEQVYLRDLLYGTNHGS